MKKVNKIQEHYLRLTSYELGYEELPEVTIFTSLVRKSLFIKWYIAFQKSFHLFRRTDWSGIFK